MQLRSKKSRRTEMKLRRMLRRQKYSLALAVIFLIVFALLMCKALWPQTSQITKEICAKNGMDYDAHANPVPGCVKREATPVTQADVNKATAVLTGSLLTGTTTPEPIPLMIPFVTSSAAATTYTPPVENWALPPGKWVQPDHRYSCYAAKGSNGRMKVRCVYTPRRPK